MTALQREVALKIRALGLASEYEEEHGDLLIKKDDVNICRLMADDCYTYRDGDHKTEADTELFYKAEQIIDKSKEYISAYMYLPCTHSAIDRALRRLGATNLSECHLIRLDGGRYNTDFLNKIVPDYDATDLPDMNDLAAVLTELSPDDIPKLIAVCDYADVESFAGAERIADNLDDFEFAEGAQDFDDLGRYLIKESGHYNYDDELDEYYDYEALGNDSSRFFIYLVI